MKIGYPLSGRFFSGATDLHGTTLIIPVLSMVFSRIQKPSHVSHKEGSIGIIDCGEAAIDNPKPLFGKVMLF